MKLRNINKTKVRKYDNGVAKQKLDYSSIASGVGTLGTMAIDVATMDDSAPSKAATAGKGALSGMSTGASMGAAGGPMGVAIGAGAGLLVGGALGLWQGSKEEDAYKAEQKKKEELAANQRTQAFNQSSQSNIADANNRGFNSNGVQQSSFYGKDGGLLKSIKYLKGGELQPVSKNTQLAVGQSHENGGIKLDAKSEIEGGETLVDKGDHALVVSDNLVNPLSGNTFAKDDLKLAKTLGRFEGKTSNLAKNSIKQINAKREILHNMQQKMNGDATDNETLEAKNGMKMYGDGGYYSSYKKTGTVNLGGGYIVRKGSNGKIEYSKDNGKTYSRPTKEVYNKLNSTAFKGKLGAYSEDTIKPISAKVTDADKNVAKPVSSDGTLPENFLQKKYTEPLMTSVDYGKTALDQAVESGDLYKPILRKSENTTLSPTATSVVKKESESKPETKEPRDYSSLNKGLGSLAKLSSYVAPHIMDWANENKNIARLKAMNIPDAPQQRFANLAKQNMEVDRAEIRKQQANYNAGISGTLADSQTAALMKANMSEKASGAISGVNQNQRNANSQISNAQTEMNLGIDARNKASVYGQKQQQMEKDVDISNRQSSNTSNLLSGFRDVQNTYRQEYYADSALDVDLAGMSPEARAEFDKITKARGAWGRRGTSLYGKNGGKLTKLAR